MREIQFREALREAIHVASSDIDNVASGFGVIVAIREYRDSCDDVEPQ